MFIFILAQKYFSFKSIFLLSQKYFVCSSQVLRHGNGKELAIAPSIAHYENVTHIYDHVCITVSFINLCLNSTLLHSVSRIHTSSLILYILKLQMSDHNLNDFQFSCEFVFVLSCAVSAVISHK